MKEQALQQKQQPLMIYHFFFFINTKSGYGQGLQYFSHNFKQTQFKYKSNRTANIYLTDLFNKQSKSKRTKQIKQLINVQNHNKVIVIVSGGDGTILWVVNQLINADINPNSILFGINPIGTGNDFSRSIGWGAQPLIQTGKKFKESISKQILKWINSESGKYDLWDVQIQTYPDGQIYDIKNQVQIRKQQTKLRKTFCNYVGMGLDARIVYTVQRKRTRNAFVNKIIYGCVGFCNFFKSLKKLDTMSLISQPTTQLSQKLNESSKKIMHPRQTQTEGSDQQSNMSNTQTLKLQNINFKSIQTIYKLKKGYRGIVCMNCPSYMCGLTQIWSTKKISQQNSQESLFKPQRFDDGQVQFITYKNELDLALQRIVRSGAKLAQGSGPFKLILQRAKNKKDQNNYMQIDGQSIKVINLKSIKIMKTQKIQGSQLNIMYNSIIQ